MSAGHATTPIGARTARPSEVPAQLAPSLWRAAAVLAAIVSIHAALVLLGYAFDVGELRSYRLGSDIPASAALSLLLISVALLLARRPRTRTRRIAGRTLALAATVLATFALLKDLAASWLADDPGGVPEPALGWMAPNAALTLLFTGAAVAALDWPRDRRLRRWPLHEPLALAATLIAYLALLGHLYGVAELYWLERATAMSLPMAVASFVLGTAVLFSRLDRGLGGLIAGRGLGGAVARRLLPAAVLIPTLLGLLRVIGERIDLYDAELGTSLLIAATVLFFGGVTTWSASALGRVDDARVRTLGALRDESVAREVERRQLRAVLDVLPVAVFISDATGRFIDVSPEARAIWAGPMPSVMGERPFRGWDAATGAPLAARDWPLTRALETGESSGAREVDIESFDGKKKTILNYAAPIRDQAGRVVGAVAVSVDITERKRGERELESLKVQLEERVRERTAELVAANAELEAFSYSVSHDLRAPLRWIDGFTRALAEDHADELGPSGREYLRQLHESVERMTQLIDALLWLSRVTMRPIDRECIDLGALAREIATELDACEPARKVAWTIERRLMVNGDGRLLRVLLDNLLRNAWKFTKEKEEAHVELGSTTVEGERVCFVRDDGVGFDESYADRLFRPFERLHGHDEFEGTGIGLALVRRIVVRHGGRVWAESRPGEGATFYFTLAPRRSER